MTNNNKLTPENIDRIVDVFAKREEEEHFAHLASYEEVSGNDYNLSVSTYVEAEDTREKIDIEKLNAEIKEIVAREQVLRDEIDKIIAESAQQRPYYYSIISGYLLEMLVRIVRERLGQPAAAPEEEAPRVATFKGVDVAALMQYIDFNYSRIISLEDLSTLAGVNKTTLISIFKEVYGTTPIRCINVSACARPRSFW